tara:strand:+ start:1067 stop:1501 length:435 start_codon:yes stop_codon:yes gene_type:complete
MTTLLFITLGLMIPNLSWNVRPLNFNTMQSTLTTWRQDYSEGSFEYKSTLEMIGWHATTQTRKGCFGLYNNYELRALSQVYRQDNETFLRSMITPNEEETAGTILMYKILEFDDIKVDWDAIQKNLRWYVAALFIKENSTSIFL